MTGEGEKPTHAAAREGDIARLVRLIDQDPKRLNERSHDGSTPLMIACMNNQVDVVRILLERKANSRTSNADRVTPLMEASRKGFFDIVRLLVDEGGADLNTLDSSQQTALFHACAARQVDVVIYLLERKANSNLSNNRRTSPLMEASRRDFLDIVRLLVEEGRADVGAVDRVRQTALHYAACHGNRDVAAFLLDNGALIEAKNAKGETALLNAALGGFHDVFDLLVERGANRDAASKTGNNLLMSVTKGGNLQLFDRVFNLHPELLNVATDDNWNLLMTAALNCHPEIVERILTFNPDVNARTLDGRHALFFAATVSLSWLEKQQNRADLDRPPREEVERRISDLQERRLAVMRFLLEYGSRKDIENEDGRTALEVADNEEVRELLRD